MRDVGGGLDAAQNVSCDIERPGQRFGITDAAGLAAPFRRAADPGQQACDPHVINRHHLADILAQAIFDQPTEQFGSNAADRAQRIAVQIFTID